MNKFWMVLANNSNITTYRHDSFEAARTEAARLARMNPAVAFFVLGSEGFAIKRDVDWHKTGDDVMDDGEIPF
jgi:hypothetical protein